MIEQRLYSHGHQQNSPGVGYSVDLILVSEERMRLWSQDQIISAFQIPSTKNLRLGQG